MKKFFDRLYADYLMPSRMGEYGALLAAAVDAGYTQTSVRNFYRAMCDGTPPTRVLVHRHDIDSDVRTARKMFAVEAQLGVKASYYFRLSTLDYGFMREIEASGSEASYHFEEVADYAKRHRIREADELRQHFSLIKEQFVYNFMQICERLGTPLATVSSHGDFVNRRLRIINHELLRDAALRARCGIECETYDQQLLSGFDLYISDRKPPVYYTPTSPFEALGAHDCIYLLTHPVQWETNWLESTRCNLRRALEELAWRL